MNYINVVISMNWAYSVSSGRWHCQAPISSLQAVLQSAEGSPDFLSTSYWTAAFRAPSLNRPKRATFILYHVILYVSLVLAQFVHCCCLATCCLPFLARERQAGALPAWGFPRKRVEEQGVPEQNQVTFRQMWLVQTSANKYKFWQSDWI